MIPPYIYIQFQQDFEERYEKYKAKILGAQKLTETERTDTPEVRQQDKKRGREQNGLNFYPETGDIEYKNELGVTKNGNKDYAFLTLLYKNKNTPFNTADIQKHCNPLVNKDAHKFKGEKDIDDTIRQIRFKLKIKKGAFFPIVKKGEKENKKWLWIEK